MAPWPKYGLDCLVPSAWEATMTHNTIDSQESIKSDLSLNGVEINSAFSAEVEKLCGQKSSRCYQCGECTAGCPAAFAMEITPNQVMRMVQVGAEKPVLESSTIWLCAGCETCATRCPRGLSVAKVMDASREIAMKKGIKAAQPNVATFHREFLADVKRNGRVHEVGMLGMYKMMSRDFFSDIPLGIKMFLKGKLVIIPSRIKGLSEVKKIFKKTAAK